LKKILLLIIVISSATLAQDVSANPTRPSAADNGYVTEYGWTELELGWFGQENFWSIPALLKVSPLNKVELGFIMSGIVNHYEFPGNSKTERGDFGLQLKGQILNVPEMAIALVGRADFYPNSITKGTIYGAMSFPRDDYQFDITAGGYFGIDNTTIDAAFLWAIALGSNFESPFNIYVEVFGENLENYNPVGFDAGLSYKVTPSFVLDAAYYTGLNDDALDWQVHVGFTKTLFKLFGKK
jgi:hypothetical protein